MQNIRFKSGLGTLVLLGVVALAVISLMPDAGYCQADPPRFEIGGQYVFVDYPEFDQTDHGLKARFTFNIDRSVAVEGEIDMFPQKKPVLNSIHSSFLDYFNSRRMKALFGVKAGFRRESFGLFRKARRGFLYISEGERYIDPDVMFFLPPEEASSQLRFALDIGAVLEI